MGFVRFILFVLIAAIVVGLIAKWLWLFIKKAKKIEEKAYDKLEEKMKDKPKEKPKKKK